MLTKRLRSRRGSNSVEFALMAPLVMLLTAGGIEYSWYYHQLMAVQDAVRQGVRTGSAKPMDSDSSCTQCETSALLRAQEILAFNGLPTTDTVDTEVSSITADDGTTHWVLTVTANVPHRSFAEGIVPSPSHYVWSNTMRIVQQ